MARGANPFYYAQDANLGPSLGAALGTALFGDPAAAAKLALQKAQMANYAATTDEANAHAGLYNSQTADQTQRTEGSKTLGDKIAALAPAPPAPVALPPGVSADDPLLPKPAPVGPTPDQVRSALPGILSAMVLAQGDKVNTPETLAQLPAYFGDDELARRSMVGQGKTPGAEFAITPQRADDIRQQGYTADYNKDTAVATINHASDIPIANIKATTDRRGQDIESVDRRRAQDLTYQGKVNAADIKASGGRTGGWTPRFRDGGDNSDTDVDGKELTMSQRLGIGTNQPVSRSQLPAVFDAIAATEGPNKRNNPGNLVDGAFAQSQPGYVGSDNGFAVFNTPEAGRQAGIALLNAYYNRGQRTITDIIEGAPVAPAKGSQPKAVSAASEKMLGDLIDAQAKANGLSLAPGAKANMMVSAAKLYQKSGNPNDAVSQVFTALHRNMANRNGGGDALRSQAVAAIQQGADPAKVKARYKSMTGQDLTGV